MPIYWDDSFAPDEIQALSAAFERAWTIIEKSGDFGLHAPEYCRSNVARHIMDIARMGERDPLRLADGAIQRYRQQIAQQFGGTFKKRAEPAAK